jgi:hypothetical protein
LNPSSFCKLYSPAWALRVCTGSNITRAVFVVTWWQVFVRVAECTVLCVGSVVRSCGEWRQLLTHWLLWNSTETFENSTDSRSGYKHLHGHTELALEDKKVNYCPLLQRKQLALKIMVRFTVHIQGTVCFP